MNATKSGSLRKILNKNFIIEKNYWNIRAAHDGYNKRYGIIHERQIEFFPEKNLFVGLDNIINKKKSKVCNFEIRFHLEPSAKIMKTQDGKSILIDIDSEGWKFSSDGWQIDIETGLYFGKKNCFCDENFRKSKKSAPGDNKDSLSFWLDFRDFA